MAENNELEILASVALDMAKSLATVQQQIKTLQSQLQGYTIKLTAELDKAASRAKIDADIKALNPANVKVTGQLDTAKTRKQIKEGLDKLRAQQVKIQGVLDRAGTIRNLKEQIQQLPTIEATASVKTTGAEQVENLRKQMDAASSSAATMATKLYLARTALQLLRRTAREAAETVKELDAAATNLAIITGGQTGDTYKTLDEYNSIARELGATTIQISEAAASWLRQGKDAAETAALIEQSIMLSKVAMIDSETATQNLTSALKGYKLAAEDAGSVVDKLAALDSKAAVTASDLDVAMSQTASSANIGGVSMDRLLGYLATVQEATQRSASTIGQSMKTIFARMGNVKLGNFFDDEGEDLSDVESSLKHYGIALRNAEGDFRGFGDVLDEVYSKWDKFRAVDQRAIAQAFAGTRQQENFLVLMQNYGKALEYAGVAADSAGTAIQKFGAYQESLEAKTAEFTAAMESLTMSTIDPGFVGDLIEASTAVIEFTEKIGILKAALVSLGVGGALKGVQMMASGVKNVTANVLSMGEAVTTLRKVEDASRLTGETITRLGLLTRGLSDNQIKAVLTTRQLSSEQMKAILMASGLSEAEAAAKLETLGLASAETTATAATGGLKTAIVGLSATIKASMAANPVGWIMMAVSAVVMLANAIDQADEKARQAAQDAYDNAAAVTKQTSAVREAYVEYNKYAGRVDLTAGEETALKSAVEKVNTALAAKADILRDLKSNTEEYTQAVRDATHAELENALAAAREEKQAAKDILESLSYSGFNGSLISIDLSGRTGIEDFVAAYNTAQELMSKFFDETVAGGQIAYELEPIGWDSNHADMDAVVAYYYNLLELKKQLALQNNTENDIYERSAEITSNLKTAVEQYVRAKYDELSAEYELAHGIPATLDELEAYRSYLREVLSDMFDYEGGSDTLSGLLEGYIGGAGFSGLLSEVTTAVTETVDTASVKLDALSDTLSCVAKVYELIADAQAEMLRAGGLSGDTIARLASITDDYTQYLYEENGAIRMNVDALAELARSQVTDETGKIKEANQAYRQQNELLEEQNRILESKKADLQSQKSQYTEEGRIHAWEAALDALDDELTANNALIEENNTAIQQNLSLIDQYESLLNPWQNVFSVFDGYTSAMQTLADIQAAVADGFTVSAEKAREFASVYPELLEAATTASDGQITLSEDVVNAFLSGKEAELKGAVEAEVTKLEAERAVLEAKMQSAQAQLDLAQNVGDDEGQITKELAEYRVNAGNAVAEAMIQAGMDEATAFKLAAAAMSQNAQEFDRIAAEVCTDIDGNFNAAAYDLAQTMYNNLSNVKTDLASVARQAHQTAQAIAGIADGTEKGSDGIIAGSGGGVGGNGVRLNLQSANFNGTDYSFTPNALSLDDFSSQLELDISGYTAAIAEIDAQIALLRSIGAKTLDNYASGASSSGGKSGKTADAKEIEEYTVAIDQYRDALRRLAEAQEREAELDRELSNAGSLEDEIAIRRQLIAVYENEQAALHALNDQRDAAIHNGVDALRDLGFEVDYDDTTNKLWIENLEHLNELTADSAGEYETIEEATNALRQETESLIDTIADLNKANQDGSKQWLEYADAIHNAIVAMSEANRNARNNAIGLLQNQRGQFVNAGDLDGLRSNRDAIIANYRAMQADAHTLADYYRSLGYSDESDEISELSDKWWEYENAVTEALQSTSDAVRTSHENAITLSENWLDSAVENRDWAGVTAHTGEIVSHYRAMQEELHDMAERYRAMGYSDTSDEVSQLSDLWWEYEKTIEGYAKQAYQKIVDAYSDALDEIQGVYDKLHKAADEYAQTGYIGKNTYQAVMSVGKEYLSFLLDENYALVINEERIRDVIAARTEQLGVETALNYVESLRSAKMAGNLEELDRLLSATEKTAAETWELVYAQLQTLGLSEKQYEQALHNINAIRTLTRSAVQGIGQAEGSVTAALNRMKDGLDDILDYVMDMIKQRIEDQISELEDMKDGYSEIIDAQKQQLENERKAASYQKTVAGKLREIAKLQAQIDVLSLDNSRDAQAKRAKLLEELAELQEGLADEQEEHAAEAMESALDRMEEDYHAEKDAEIETLRDSISSQQKLYEKAVDYISGFTLDEWGKLLEELRGWNYQYGSDLEQDIVSAWESALDAAKQYGDYLTALNEIQADIEKAGASGQNLQIGQSYTAPEPMAQGGQAAEPARRPEVRLVNEDGHAPAGMEAGDYVVTAGGVYRITEANGGQNYKSEQMEDYSGYTRQQTIAKYEDFKYLLEHGGVFHRGGVVGGEVRDDERFALLRKKEWVLTEEMAARTERVVNDALNHIGMLQTLSEGVLRMSDSFRVAGAQLLKPKEVSSVSPAVSAPMSIEINVGDTVINGANEETVRQHQEISRKNVNDMIAQLGIRRRMFF